MKAKEVESSVDLKILKKGNKKIDPFVQAAIDVGKFIFFIKKIFIFVKKNFKKNVQKNLSIKHYIIN